MKLQYCDCVLNSNTNSKGRQAALYKAVHDYEVEGAKHVLAHIEANDYHRNLNRIFSRAEAELNKEPITEGQAKKQAEMKKDIADTRIAMEKYLAKMNEGIPPRKIK